MLDIDRDNGVIGVDLKASRILDVTVVLPIDQTFIPPLDVGRGRNKKSLLGLQVFVYTSFASRLGYAPPHIFKRSLSAESIRLLNILAFLIKNQLPCNPISSGSSLGAKAWVKVRILSCLF